MKLWLVMFLVILVIVFGGIQIQKSVLKTTDQLSHDLDLLQGHVKAERWQEAQDLSGSLDRFWSQQRKVWAPFIHNHELDVIAGNLAVLVSLLESEEKSDALGEIALLKVRLVQLHHQEIFTLTNIF